MKAAVVHEFIKKLGGADAAISKAASPGPLTQAYRSLRRGGKLVLVGLPADNSFPLPIFETVLQGIHVIGSIVGTRVDLAEVFELHAAGRPGLYVRPAGLKTSTTPSPRYWRRSSMPGLSSPSTITDPRWRRPQHASCSSRADRPGGGETAGAGGAPPAPVS